MAVAVFEGIPICYNTGSFGATIYIPIWKTQRLIIIIIIIITIECEVI